MDDWGPNGLSLAKLDALLALAEYFFVAHGAPPHPSRAPMRTRSNDDLGGEITGEIVVTVYPIRRRPTQIHPFVAIGRIDGNDIALHDETVSKFHAFVKERSDGLYLQDARSRNGTVLDGKPVPVRGVADPLKLTVGATARFGSVVTTFVDRATLREVSRLKGLNPTSAKGAGGP